ncbi:MAG: hypothetical protein ACO21G_10395 [Algoriphagus sp.]
MNKSVLIGGIIAIILIAGGLYFYSTIDNGGDGPFDNPLGYYEENIENYHEAALGLQAKIPAGNQSVYVDFSD